MSIGNNIKIARAAAGLTQKELALKCDLAEITIRQYETGKREPRMTQIQKIATALGCTSSFLLSSGNHDKVTEWGLVNNQFVSDLDGVMVALVDIYGKVQAMEDKENNLLYYIIGENDSSFILYKEDIHALYSAVKGFLPPLIKRIKELSAEIPEYQKKDE